jgi:hypothetical protein
VEASLTVSRPQGTITTEVALPYVFAFEVLFRLAEIADLINLPPLQTSVDFETHTLANLDQIVTFLQSEQLKNAPAKISLGAPLALKQGKLTVANIELANDEVLFIPILTDNAEGMPVAPPAGDTFSVVSDSPSLAVAIDTTTLAPPGTPAVKINATVQASPGLSFTVSDSAGLTVFIQGVDIVPDTTPKAITLDLAHEVVQAQPVPTVPGP